MREFRRGKTGRKRERQGREILYVKEKEKNIEIKMLKIKRGKCITKNLFCERKRLAHSFHSRTHDIGKLGASDITVFTSPSSFHRFIAAVVVVVLVEFSRIKLRIAKRKKQIQKESVGKQNNERKETECILTQYLWFGNLYSTHTQPNGERDSKIHVRTHTPTVKHGNVHSSTILNKVCQAHVHTYVRTMASVCMCLCMVYM